MSCGKCENGYIYRQIDGYEFVSECECLKNKLNAEKQAKYIADSGLEKVLATLTFENFKEDTQSHTALKKKAFEYLKNYEKKWWFIAGVSGCGKTHITTAICGELIKASVPVHYMQWRDESVELKALSNDMKYAEKIRKLKKVKVLYIDDFFKGEPTKADVKLAFEIINARYNSKLTTLFSSELDINQILQIDEAVAGRINQMANDYVLNIKNIGNRRIQ